MNPPICSICSKPCTAPQWFGVLNTPLFAACKGTCATKFCARGHAVTRCMHAAREEAIGLARDYATATLTAKAPHISRVLRALFKEDDHG